MVIHGQELNSVHLAVNIGSGSDSPPIIFASERFDTCVFLNCNFLIRFFFFIIKSFGLLIHNIEYQMVKLLLLYKETKSILKQIGEFLIFC